MKFQLSTSIVLLTLIGLSGCATTRLNSELSEEKQDSFREESFLRYTKSRLGKLENTPYAALSKCHSDDVNQGLKDLQKMTHDKKKDPEFWNQIGMCYFLADHLVKAEYFFQFSIDLNPKNRYAPALNNLGTIKLKQGHYDMALDYFKKAAEFKKGQTNLKVPLFNQAQVYLQFNLLENALTIFEALDRQNSGDPDIMMGLASVNLLEGKTGQALDILHQIPQEYRDREDITLIKALALYETGKIDEVYELLKEYNFTQYVPMKKSAQMLKKLVTAQVRKREILEKEKQQQLRQKQIEENKKKFENELAQNKAQLSPKK